MKLQNVTGFVTLKCYTCNNECEIGAYYTMQTNSVIPGKTMVVCIDSYSNGEPAGRLFNPAGEECRSFANLLQFLLELDSLLDAIRFPQPSVLTRRFPAEARESAPTGQDGSTAEGKLATFKIRVLFRHNASWQGSVAWMETGREENFRSALELLLLMDSALGE